MLTFEVLDLKKKKKRNYPNVLKNLLKTLQRNFTVKYNERNMIIFGV